MSGFLIIILTMSRYQLTRIDFRNISVSIIVLISSYKWKCKSIKKINHWYQNYSNYSETIYLEWRVSRKFKISLFKMKYIVLLFILYLFKPRILKSPTSLIFNTFNIYNSIEITKMRVWNAYLLYIYMPYIYM